jgi:hypothetical protein
MPRYQVTLYRTNEGYHEDSEQSFVATSVITREDGSVWFTNAEGSKTFSAHAWGSFDFARLHEKPQSTTT